MYFLADTFKKGSVGLEVQAFKKKQQLKIIETKIRKYLY
jgi:hypothetical protein